MKTLKKPVTSIVLALSLVLSLSITAFAAEETNLETSAQAAAAYAAQYGSTQSLQYALWEDGAVTTTGHVGTYSRTEDTALTDDNLYGAGSISKMYLTSAVMKLAEDEKLELDAPVTKYLPSFKMADERYTQITVRMLLNHSSGLMGSTLENAFLFEDTERSATENLLDRLSTQRLKAAPGAYSVYCNDGFTLAELVVEAVSGMSFPEYLQKEILSPAGLNDTFVPGGDFNAARLAKIYNGTDTRALPQECIGVVGTGGIYATASDLASFGGALTATNLLSQASLDAMADSEYKNGMWPEDDLDWITFGLGWDSVKIYPFCQSDIQALVKGGDTTYYHSGLVVIPEYNMAAAVVSSGGLSTYNEMAAIRILIAALAEKGITVDESVPSLPSAQTSDIPEAQLQNAGYYGATTQQMKIDISSDGILTLKSMTYPDTPPQTLSYFSDGSFRDATGSAMVKFVSERNGKTYLYQKVLTPIPGLGILPASNYLAEKLDENAISEDTQKAWDAVNTLNLVPMNLKYSSQVYLALSSQNSTIPEMIPGYLGSCRIIDESNALYELQIPGSGGRDGHDISFYEKNGINWITVGSILYMSAEGVPCIYASSQSYATVQPDGYARWYEIGEAAGKTMDVTVPEHAGFYVYDDNGQLVASSVLWGDTQAELPEGGTIVFAGDAGAHFELDFQ